MYTLLLIVCFQDAVRQAVKDDHFDLTYRDHTGHRRRFKEIETRLMMLEYYQRYRRTYGGINRDQYR